MFEDQPYVRGADDERAKIVAWLRSFYHNKNALEFADAIEAREDDKGPIVYPFGNLNE